MNVANDDVDLAEKRRCMNARKRGRLVVIVFEAVEAVVVAEAMKAVEAVESVKVAVTAGVADCIER